MNILTKRNGIALVAVMIVLLTLTLLLPVMFTMADNATASAMRGTDEQRAAYLARTMIEMSVASFEDFYDKADEAEKAGGSENPNHQYYTEYTKYKKFISAGYQQITAETVYMYRNNDVTYPEKPSRADYNSDDEYNAAMETYEEALKYYADNGNIYCTQLPNGVTDEDNLDTGAKYVVTVKVTGSESKTYNNCSYVGRTDCTIKYVDEPSYYAIDKDGNTEEIDVDTYTGGAAALEQLITNGVDVTNETQYVKIENKNVIFNSIAVVNGKAGSRRCVLVLPTKPSEENWIAPANIGSNQIFPDTSLATGRTNINYASGTLVDGSAVKQPLYIFSCVGNMVISDKNLKFKNGDTYTDYADYVNQINSDSDPDNDVNYDPNSMSFGLHPETGTRDPDNDPTFNCLRTYNMESWHSDAQLDNYVAFTATNAIQVDLPVNLIINPSRVGAEKGRLGDGFDKNYSLYKVLIFQAPTIVFNRSVSSFLSLYQTDEAYRMSTIMFAAPNNTPYSYVNGSRGQKTVKAGKVFFAEDAYVWLVPYGETGSNYSTQTVYYKNKDIIVYKIANAGDIYYFNAEVETNIDGKKTNSGFSLTGYFIDVIYNEHGDDFTNNSWWQFWSNAKLKLFNSLVENYGERTYLKDDFKWIGNVYSGIGDSLPVVDDFYVVWDS